MDCHQFKNNLIDFCDKDLSVGKKNEMETHLQTCAACNEILINFQSLFAQLEQEKSAEVSPYFTNRVIAKISSETEQIKRAPNLFFAIPSRLTAAVLGTGIMTGIALSVFLFFADVAPVDGDALKNELVSDRDNTILTLNDE